MSDYFEKEKKHTTDQIKVAAIYSFGALSVSFCLYWLSHIYYNFDLIYLCIIVLYPLCMFLQGVFFRLMFGPEMNKATFKNTGGDTASYLLVGNFIVSIILFILLAITLPRTETSGFEIILVVGAGFFTALMLPVAFPFFILGGQLFARK